MSRIEEKVRSLLEQEELEDEIRELLDGTDGEDPFEWKDVEHLDVTTGTWGRLIQTGVLESEGDGFVFSDRQTIKDILDENNLVEYKATGWSRRDKIAGVAGLFLIMSYSLPGMRGQIGETINIFFAPLMDGLPLYVIIILLGVATGLVSSLVREAMVDNETIKQVKDRIEVLKEAQNDSDEKTDDIQSFDDLPDEQREMLGLQKVMMLEQFRPMVWILLLTVPVFLWLYWKAVHPSLSEADRILIMPFIGEVDLGTRIFGPFFAWIIWYVLISATATQLIRKYLNIGF